PTVSRLRHETNRLPRLSFYLAHACRRELATMARSKRDQRQRFEESSYDVVVREKYCLENAVAFMERRHPGDLGKFYFSDVAVQNRHERSGQSGRGTARRRTFRGRGFVRRERSGRRSIAPAGHFEERWLVALAIRIGSWQ